MAAKCVLVIDDEDAIREVIQGCLEELAGWQVLVAGSGSQGLQLAASESPDGILLDLSMPGINGIETLRKLRQNRHTAEIPVALLTGKVQVDDQSELAQLNVASIIVKPFDPLGLVNQVATAFGWDR